MVARAPLASDLGRTLRDTLNKRLICLVSYVDLASIVGFMASTIKVTPQKEKIPENEGSETPHDRPLLDLSGAAVKELIHTAKKRG